MCAWIDCETVHLMRARDERGVALITALAMLVLFSLLGSAYLGYMLHDRDGVTNTVNHAYAQHAAEAGVYAAIGDLQRTLNLGGDLPATIDYEFPIYRAENDTLTPRSDATLSTSVVVSDENARININFASRGMLERILNVDRAMARRISSELPRAGETATGPQRWFTSVGDLVSRGYLTPAAFEQLNKDFITVYTGDELSHPREYINLNTAPAEVVAAVLNVPLDRAVSIAQGPPLTTLADLTNAAGQDASTFNTIADPDALPNALPSELTLKSRTVRLVSKATISGNAVARASSARVEAVVFLDNDGPPKIRYWSVERGRPTSETTVTTEAEPEGQPITEPSADAPAPGEAAI